MTREGRVSGAEASPGGLERPTWTFLTNHLHVLLCIARDPDIRLRDVATLVGITERAAQSIVADLVQADLLTRTRVGRRNRYQVHPDHHLRHPLERDYTVGALLEFFGSSFADHRDAQAI